MIAESHEMGEGSECSDQVEIPGKAKLRNSCIRLLVECGLKECELSYKPKGNPSDSDLSLDTIVSEVKLR